MKTHDTIMSRSSPAPIAVLLGGLLLTALISGCSQPQPPAEPEPVTTEAASPAAPPSFLDEPPPPPVSDTIILSGGTLVGTEDQFDAVVVVEGARVIAAGKRGTVPVPPDSIGIDTSGKFIVAVDPDQTLIGGPADLIVYDSHPDKDQQAAVHARVVAGEWRLTNP